MVRLVAHTEAGRVGYTYRMALVIFWVLSDESLIQGAIGKKRGIER